MAVNSKDRTKNKKQNGEHALGFFRSLWLFLRDERTHFALGLMLVIWMLYVLLSMLSYSFTGKADQSALGQYEKIEEQIVAMKAMEKKAKRLANESGDAIAKDEAERATQARQQAERQLHKMCDDVQNWTGYRGAKISEVMINNWFGVASFLLLIFPIIFGFRLIGIRVVALWKAFLYPALAVLWLSVLLAFVCNQVLGIDSFYNFGGNYGCDMATWMSNNFGKIGMILILVGTGLLFALIMFSGTLPWMKRCLQKFHSSPVPINDDTVETPQKPETLDNVETVETVESQCITEIVPETPQNTESPTTIGDSGISFTSVDTNNMSPATSVPDTGEDDDESEDDLPIENAGDDTEQDTHSITPEELVAKYGPYDPTADLSDYKYPPITLLKQYPLNADDLMTAEEIAAKRKQITNMLQQFGIGVKQITETIGPTVTLYEMVPADGVRISKIRNLEADIMLSLAATGIRIIAPIPGKGTIGIEVPNRKPRIVSMYDAINTTDFQNSKYALPVVLGRTITNTPFLFDLTKMPHLLVAGATGQGKSVGLNAIITSLLYKKHPSQLKFVLIDPKKVEFNIYADIEKHFMAELPEAEEPVITDVDKVKQTLNSLCKEMDNRYDLLKAAHTRNIKEYNEKFINRRLNPEKGHRYLPYIVVIVDEFGDLIMTAGKDVEMPIARIAQLARAVGIHMVIATQRPSVNIITGIIKANFPARIAFKVSSLVDSRTILDGPGAQQLIGRGDLLFSQGNEMTRVQCAFVDTPEVEKIVQFISMQRGYSQPFLLPEPDTPESEFDTGSVDLTKRDKLFEEVARNVVATQMASASNIQRKFSLGFTRAARIVDQLESANIIGPADGSKPRQVLVPTEYELEKILNGLG